jgi:FADH2 O2-dependent halogenase
MIHEAADVAILGAGFAGSVLALVLQRIGRRPVLIERGVHPRFAIGESSTPLANLSLEELGRRYDLPQLFSLSEYGRWQKAHPKLACGLKRGFSYFQHQAGRAFEPTPKHDMELLVAANPNDEVAETHWFREQFDHFLVQEVQRAGIPYYDRTEVQSLERSSSWRLRGNRMDRDFTAIAKFIIDATGPASLLAKAEEIDTRPTRIRTNCWSVYSHFTGVPRWETILAELGGNTVEYPFRADDAALHHLLEDGWIWVLPFNNGITSVGVAYDGDRRPMNATDPPEMIWADLLQRYPSLARHFAAACPAQPFVRTGRLQRCAECVVGPDWAMLSHAAYFLDPFFSGGIAHSLLSIERLADILENHWDRPSLPEQLQRYQAALLREVDFLDLLIHGCYQTFGRFPLFAAYSMYYFAAAILNETRRRAGEAGPWSGFLSADWPGLHEAVRRTHDELPRLTVADTQGLQERVVRDINSINPAGLCDPRKNNMYPFVAT